MRPLLGIVIPTLNEAAYLPTLLASLETAAPGIPLTVADGGSTDGTVALARAAGCRVLVAPRGRARQMNAGAQATPGDVLWFVHADSLAPPTAEAEIVRLLEDPAVVGGCFRLRFPRREWVYRISDRIGNWAVDLTGIALGDHGIFVRRSAFEAMDGFPDVPLMEDADFYRAAGRQGRMVQLPAAMVTAPRRYERHGPWRVTAAYLVLLVLYCFDLSRSRLRELYDRWVG